MISGRKIICRKILFLLCLILLRGLNTKACPTGDLSGDCKVDLKDLRILAEHWLDPGCSGTDCAADINNADGVNLVDIALLMGNWQKTTAILLISEFLANNDNIFPTIYVPGGELKYPDWIEIYNPTEATIDLAGWYLEDEGTQWQFPTTDEIIIGPDEYKVVYASGMDFVDPYGFYHTNFNLNTEGEYIALIRTDNVIVHEYHPQYPTQSDDVSFGLSSEIENREDTTLISSDADIKVLVPQNGALGTTWTQAAFDASSWPGGSSGAGYEDNSGYEYLINTTVPSGTITFYTRFKFYVDNPAVFTDLLLRVKYDDAYVAYLNGVKVASSSSAPASPQWDSYADYGHGDAKAVIFEDRDISTRIGLLNAGSNNVLAIHAMNQESIPPSSDMLLLPELIGTISTSQEYIEVPMFFDTPTPMAHNQGGTPYISSPIFSRSSGLFTDNFSVILTSKSPTHVIRYTIDGSAPTESSSVYSSPIFVSGSIIISTAAYDTDSNRSPTNTQRYTKLEADAQNFSSNLPIVVIDTLGNPLSGGARATSFSVFIDTDAATGRATITDEVDFVGRTGMKIRGASSRSYFPKKQYSFETWDENSEDIAVSILGMPAESDWILQAPYSDKTLMRNYLSYKWSNDIGRYASRCRFVEVFLDIENNGVSYSDYVGVYVLMEKLKRDENRIDIDKLRITDTSEPAITGGYIIKIDRPDSSETPIGTTMLPNSPDNELLCIADPGVDQLAACPQQLNWIVGYLNDFETALSGGSFADPVSGYPGYVDVDSFIDHHIIVETMKNIDGFRLSTWLYKDRNEKLNLGPVWDYNLALANADYYGANSSSGWYGDILAQQSIGRGVNIWLMRMFDDVEFKLGWESRWAELRKGPFDTDRMMADIDEAAALLQQEAAQRNFTRWPLGAPGQWVWPNPPGWETRDTHQKEVDYMKDWLQGRLDWLDTHIAPDSQLQNDPVSTPYPTFSQNGGQVPVGFALTITATEGTIYYSIDGTDPRQPYTGTIVGTQYAAPITLHASAHVMARAKSGDQWSPLNEARFSVGPVAESMRITEIMYHPKDPPQPSPYNDEDFEYIELRNIGPDTLDLTGVKFTDGISYNFTAISIDSGEYLLVAKDPNAFVDRYPGVTGVEILGPYEGQLNNAGEKLILEDASGSAIHDFEYKDGWRPLTDGIGFSLTIIDPNSANPNDWCEKGSWRASSAINGSPGNDDQSTLPNPGAIVINEVLAHADTIPEDWIELYNTTGTTIDISGWFLSDKDSNLMKQQIANGTVIEPNDYLVLYKSADFDEFGLSENGEAVYLTSGSVGELTGYHERQDFGASQADIAFGRYYKPSTGNYNFVSMASNSHGDLNGLPKVGPIVITEIMYHPDMPEGSWYDSQQYEYIELYNISPTVVTLYDPVGGPWKFTDGVDFTCPDAPSQVTMDPGEFLIVAKNPDALTSQYTIPGGVQILGPYDGKLANDGEKLELSMPGDTDGQQRFYICVDRVNYSDGSHSEDCPGGVDLWPTEADGTGKSLGRLSNIAYGNDPVNWHTTSPSPGSKLTKKNN